MLYRSLSFYTRSLLTLVCSPSGRQGALQEGADLQRGGGGGFPVTYSKQKSDECGSLVLTIACTIACLFTDGAKLYNKCVVVSRN